MEDYYKILEVQPNAVDAKIKESYRRLALILHPDKNQSPNATDQFQRLGRAWDVLKDHNKRHHYDMQRRIQFNAEHARMRWEVEEMQRRRQREKNRQDQERYRQQELARRQAEMERQKQLKLAKARRRVEALRKQEEARLNDARRQEEKARESAAAAKINQFRKERTEKENKLAELLRKQEEIEATTQATYELAQSKMAALGDMKRDARTAEAIAKRCAEIRKGEQKRQNEQDEPEKESRAQNQAHGASMKSAKVVIDLTGENSSPEVEFLRERPAKRNYGSQPARGFSIFASPTAFSTPKGSKANPRSNERSRPFGHPSPPRNIFPDALRFNPVLPKPIPELHENPAYRKVVEWKSKVMNQYSTLITELQSIRSHSVTRIIALKASIEEAERAVRNHQTKYAASLECSKSHYRRMFEGLGTTFTEEQLQHVAETNSKSLMGDPRGLLVPSELNNLKEALAKIQQKSQTQHTDWETREFENRQNVVNGALAFVPLRGMFSNRPSSASEVLYRAHWTSLAQIRPGLVCCSQIPISVNDGPWHDVQPMEGHSLGDACGRCKGNLVIAARQPFRCHRCEIIICDNCRVDLSILQEWAVWLEHSLDESLFEITEDMIPKLI